MRYWLLENGASRGPFAREELPSMEGFSRDSLVCSESYAGDGSSGWMRAALVPAIRPLLPPDFHIAIAGGGKQAAWLPPEPSLEDAAGMASLDERIRRLEELLAASMHRVRERDAEQVRLRAAIGTKDSVIEALRRELAGLGSRLASLASLHEELQRTYGQLLEQRGDVQNFARKLVEIRAQVDAALAAGASSTEETVAEAKRLLQEAEARVEEAVKTAEKAVRAARKNSPLRARVSRIRRRRGRPPKPPKDGSVFPGAPAHGDIPGF